MLTVPSWSSKASVMILSRNMLKRVGESRHPCQDSNCCLEPVSYAAVEEDGTSGLVIRGFWWRGSGWRWCCTSSWLSIKLHSKPCRRPPWSLWRHGRGLAGAEDISHRGFVGWRSALWCSCLLWSLPVIQRWPSPLVASICSVWSIAWLYLGDWWGWSFGSSGTENHIVQYRYYHTSILYSFV